MPSALVIGAGIGGIAAATRLAQHGFEVTIVEKNDRAGGRCNYMVRDGHYFDTGPTLFVMPDLFERAFADLGERMDESLDLRRIDPTYHIHFDDGSTLALTSDLRAMQKQLEAFEAGSYGGFLRYLNEGYFHYKLSLAHFVERNFESLLDFLSLRNLLMFTRLKVLIKHNDNVSKYFRDPRLQHAFTFQDMYVGLSPYDAPAIYSLLQYTELADGVWFPMGGMYRVVEALVDVAEKWGVQFVYDTPVTRIDVNERKASGVYLVDGKKMPADVIIVNADLPYAYRDLLPDDDQANRLAGKKYGCSTLMFFWGMDKQYPQLETHNLFIRKDYRQGFDRIFSDLTLPETPSFYVHTPVRVDPSLAPPGQDSLTAIVPVGHLDEDTPQDWDAIRNRARRAVLQRLAEVGISDLEEHIKFEVSYTPHDWRERYNLVKGSTHGLSHTIGQMGYLRPRNRHARYRNLYFVGASTHPGTGMPTVLVSSRLAVKRILEDIKP